MRISSSRLASICFVSFDTLNALFFVRSILKEKILRLIRARKKTRKMSRRIFEEIFFPFFLSLIKTLAIKKRKVKRRRLENSKLCIIPLNAQGESIKRFPKTMMSMRSIKALSLLLTKTKRA